MLTQTHTRKFNEWTWSRARSPELSKVPALTSVCNLALRLSLQDPGVFFTGLQPSSGAPGPPETEGCCTPGPPGSVGVKPAVSLLDTSELLLFERLATCANCNGKARDIRLAQRFTSLPDFSHFPWSRRCQTLPQSLFSNTGTVMYFLPPFRNYWDCSKFFETIQPRQTFTQTKMRTSLKAVREKKNHKTSTVCSFSIL